MSIFKNISTKSMVMFTLALGIFGVISFGASPSAYALAKDAVWIGASCYDEEATLPDDCNWSVVGNWSNGGDPVDGDTITFDNESLTSGQNFGHNNKSNLQITSMTFTGDPVEDFVYIVDGNEITVTDGIYKNTSGSINLYLDIKLGDDIVVENNNDDGWLSFGNDDEIHNIDLNNHKVSFSYKYGILIYDVIEGIGDIEINDIHTGVSNYFRLNSTNTYEGTTTILSGTTVLDKNATFGDSEITISSLADIMLYASANKTIENIITIEGSTENSPLTSLSFFTNYGNPIKYTVPNIVLNGDTRFASDSTTTVDIDGITLNNHCIEYNGNDEDRFLNGPIECDVIYGTPPATAPVVKAPDTAMSSFKLSNPLSIAALGIMAVFSILLLTSRKRSYKR